MVNLYQIILCQISEDSNLQMKRKVEGIYLSTKRQGVTWPHSVTSQKTVSIKSYYIQLGTEPYNQLIERGTEVCHPAVFFY